MGRKIDFRENWLIFLGIWGEAELILRIWGAKEKYFQGAEEFFFQGFWEMNPILSGIKGAQMPHMNLHVVLDSYRFITFQHLTPGAYIVSWFP